MKKVLFILFLILMLSGCGSEGQNKDKASSGGIIVYDTNNEKIGTLIDTNVMKNQGLYLLRILSKKGYMFSANWVTGEFGLLANPYEFRYLDSSCMGAVYGTKYMINTDEVRLFIGNKIVFKIGEDDKYPLDEQQYNKLYYLSDEEMEQNNDCYFIDYHETMECKLIDSCSSYRKIEEISEEDSGIKLSYPGPLRIKDK